MRRCGPGRLHRYRQHQALYQTPQEYPDHQRSRVAGTDGRGAKTIIFHFPPTMSNMKTTKTVSISPSRQYWRQVQVVARPKAEALGITEDDVTRLINEYRKEKRTKTNKNKTKCPES